jgi:iron complex transport system substrate-binding protein
VPYTVAPWGTPWQDQLEAIGQALGRPTQAAALEASTTKTIVDAVAANPQLKGRSAAWAWFSPTDLSTIGLYTTADLRPQMLREFGLVDSPTVVELSKADPSAFSVNLSAEKASTLDADLVVFYAAEGTQTDDIMGNALLSQIPALRKKQFVASADNAIALSMSLPSPLSVRTAVDDFLPKIATALSGTPTS